MPVYQSQHNQGVHYFWGSPMISMQVFGSRRATVFFGEFEIQTDSSIAQFGGPWDLEQLVRP